MNVLIFMGLAVQACDSSGSLEIAEQLAGGGSNLSDSIDVTKVEGADALSRAPSGSTGEQTVVSDFSDKLALLPRGIYSHMSSSFDPTGGNDDGFTGLETYLYEEGGNKVLADIKGKGVVERIIMNPYDPGNYGSILNWGRLTILVDDQPVPFFNDTARRFFERTTSALSGYEAGAFFSYEPIPFQERLKIITTGGAHHYQISYTKGPLQTTLSVREQMFQKTGRYPHKTPINYRSFGEYLVAPSEQITLTHEDGPAVIYSVKCEVGRESAWKDLRLRIKWDDLSRYSVDIPLGMLFGASDPVYRINSMFFRLDPESNEGECFYPMPFNERCAINIYNSAQEQHSVRVSASIHAAEYKKPFGYFSARYNESLPTQAGYDHPLLETDGWGKIVGMVQEHEVNTNIPLWSFNYLEGDERVYIDDSGSPSIHGTGGEVTFNWGWYGLQNMDYQFSLPVHGYSGQIVRDQPLRLHRSMYRVYIEPVMFYKNVAMSQEHGPVNNFNANYRSAVFFYRRDPALILSDEVDFGNPESESDHDVQITGQNSPVTLTSSYPGDNARGSPFTDKGYNVSGILGFKTSALPINKGIRIRLRIDNMNGPHEFDIKVNGNKAGAIYDPSSNKYHRWHDVEVDISGEKLSFANSESRNGIIEVELIPVGKGAVGIYHARVYYYTGD